MPTRVGQTQSNPMDLIQSNPIKSNFDELSELLCVNWLIFLNPINNWVLLG